MKANRLIEGVFPPPAGIIPSLKNPDFISGGIIPISVVFLTLSSLFLALRIYTRVRAFYAEDCELKISGYKRYEADVFVDVIIVSWFFSAAFTATCLGRDYNGLPTERTPNKRYQNRQTTGMEGTYGTYR